jgi:non-specific serine/threonine protein kinase
MVREARVTKQLGNLPAEVSSFVDRRRECAELKRLITASRLVTVTGVGGVGKTRTALRVAAEMRRSFADGVWWVELSTVQQSDLIAPAVAEVLGLRDQTTRPLLDVLSDHLSERRMLLVLDTCEHLVDACAQLAGALLRAAVGLRVLATSRQPLGLTGEHMVAVPPLGVPGPGSWDPGVASGPSPALELFVERAKALDHDFTLAGDNRTAVAMLCRRLDGIPLAIELAAARVRALSPQQILALLDDRFGLLVGGSRAGLARHATLQTAIAWSHELCTPAERLLWSRASVFAGDFDLTGAQEVCADDRLTRDAMLDVMAGLVDKSVLLRSEHPSGTRYRLLDTMREYGLDRLRKAGEDAALRHRHVDYYLAMARRLDAQWCGPDQVEWYERMNREHANLRAALDFCLTEPEAHRAGLELAGTLRYLWVCCGFLRDGRRYLDSVLGLDPAPGPALTTALWTGAYVAAAQGDLDAAEARVAQCRPYAEQQGDDVAAGWIAYIATVVTLFRGDVQQAIALGKRSADLHRSGGDPGIGLLVAFGVLSLAFGLAGEPDRAVEVSEECRKSCDEYGEQWARSYVDYLRAVAELGRGDAKAAVTYARDALRFKRLLGDSLGIALAVDALASAAAALGDAERAARLLGIANQVWHTFGLPQFGAPNLAAARHASERQARDILGDPAYEAAFRAGLRLDPDAGIAYALDEQPERSPAAARQRTGWAPLTRREREIAELVAEGLTNPRIAARLTITNRTVATHIEHILTKLGFATRAQIAAWVAERRPDPEVR